MKQNIKISRGYRLKHATHALIKDLQDLTNSDTEEVISRSCRLYLKKIFEIKKIDKLNINISGKGNIK